MEKLYSFASCELCKKPINLHLDNFQIYTPYEECEIVMKPHLLVCEQCHKKLYKKDKNNIC